MKAAVLHAHGDLDALRVVDDHPEPVAGPGEVVLDVAATALNYHDLFTVRGMPGITIPLPVVPGLDLAGTVREVGANVTGWSPGDRVLVDPLDRSKGLIGEVTDGGLEERVAVNATQLIRVPDGVTLAQAAALPVAYGTAHRMLFTHGKIKAGEKVLVLGASGGVGTACVLLAKLAGADVIACASSERKLEALRALGADVLIDYTKEPFEKAVFARYGKPHRRTYDGGVDVIVNFTGGDTWVPSLKALKRGGRLLVCGATAGFDPKEDLRYLWTFELQVLGSNSWAREDLTALLDLIAQKKLDPTIDRVLPLERIGEGLRLLSDREVLGKVVFAPNGDPS